jgi:hypothetical protein
VILTVRPYCTGTFISIKERLAQLFFPRGMRDVMTQHQRRQRPPNGTLMEVYDGSVWRERLGEFFQISEFVGIGLMLTSDWVEVSPFSKTKVLCVIVSLMNLPWNLRNQRENQIVYALTNTSTEQGFASLLKEFCQEMQELMDTGMEITDANGIAFNVKCCMICTCMDEQAIYKALGVGGHMSFHCCYRCLWRAMNRAKVKHYWLADQNRFMNNEERMVKDAELDAIKLQELVLKVKEDRTKKDLKRKSREPKKARTRVVEPAENDDSKESSDKLKKEEQKPAKPLVKAKPPSGVCAAGYTQQDMLQALLSGRTDLGNVFEHRKKKVVVVQLTGSFL